MKPFAFITAWLSSNYELGIVVSITTFLATVTHLVTGVLGYVTLGISVLVGLVTLYGKVRDEIDKQRKRNKK